MDIAIVFIYFVGLIFIGGRAFRTVKGINGFFVAERKGSFILIAGSLFATIIGGSSTIGMAGLGYKMGLVGSWWLLVGTIGLFLLGLFIAKKVRRYSVYTLPEILEIQYGTETKIFASALIIIAWMGIIAGQIVAAGKILGTIIEAPSTLLMTITAFVFIVYTLLGGQYSVVRTDTIQGLIIIVAILVSAPLCLHKAGGVLEMKEVLGYEYFSFPVNKYFSLKSLATYIFLIGSTYLVGPDIYSRIFCARDEETAKKASIAVALILVPFAFAITMIGMSARVLFPQINPEASFPLMVNYIFPAGLNGLVIAALLAAMMSSADTCLLTTSTILSMDLVKPFLKSGFTEDKLLLLSRFFIVFMGIFSLILALVLKGVIPSLMLGYTVYTSGLVFPILLGFYRHKLKLNRAGAISAMVAGGGLALIGNIMGWKLFDFSTGLYGFFLSGFTIVIVSRFSR